MKGGETSIISVHKMTLAAAWTSILSTTAEVGKVRPIVERTYKLEDAAEALRHLIEDRPFGRGIGW